MEPRDELPPVRPPRESPDALTPPAGGFVSPVTAARAPAGEGAGARAAGERVVEASAQPGALRILRTPHARARAHDGPPSAAGPRRPVASARTWCRRAGRAMRRRSTCSRSSGRPTWGAWRTRQTETRRHSFGASVGWARVDRGLHSPLALRSRRTCRAERIEPWAGSRRPVLGGGCMDPRGGCAEKGGGPAVSRQSTGEL